MCGEPKGDDPTSDQPMEEEMEDPGSDLEPMTREDRKWLYC